MRVSQPRTQTRALTVQWKRRAETLAATRNELGAWRRGQRTGGSAARGRARGTHRRYTSCGQSTRGGEATNVSLNHSDSTFLKERAQRHVTHRQRWDTLAQTRVPFANRRDDNIVDNDGGVRQSVRFMIVRQIQTEMSVAIDRLTNLSARHCPA